MPLTCVPGVSVQMIVLVLMKLGFVAAGQTSVDVEPTAVMVKIEAMQEQMAEQAKTIRMLTDALEAKAADHKQHVQLTTGGEVVELASAADVKVLKTRVEACEKKIAEIGMTAVRKTHEDALPRPLPPPLPPPRPAAMPGRRLSSSSNGGFVNELSITGPNAVVSWNSNSPGLTSFNCTGVGDGSLTCSGTLHVVDVIAGNAAGLVQLSEQVAALRQYVGMIDPPPSSPPAPPAPPSTPPPPSIPPSPAPPPAGWYASRTTGTTCTSTCSAVNLQCFEASLEQHNGDVDSAEGLITVLEGILGYNPCTSSAAGAVAPDLPSGAYGTNPDLPAYKPQGTCYFTSSSSEKTYSCSAIVGGSPGYRVCYCQ